MGKHEDSDRRRDPRIPKSTFTAISTGGIHANDQAFGLITDVSVRGICVQTPQPPQVADVVKLKIGVGETVHEISARAVRVTDAGGEAFSVGLEFDPGDPAAREFLDAHLGGQLEGVSASWQVQ